MKTWLYGERRNTNLVQRTSWCREPWQSWHWVQSLPNSDSNSDTVLQGFKNLVNVTYHFYEEKTKKAQRSCCLKFVFHWKRKAKLPFATVLQYNSASLPLQCEQSVWLAPLTWQKAPKIMTGNQVCISIKISC